MRWLLKELESDETEYSMKDLWYKCEDINDTFYSPFAKYKSEYIAFNSEELAVEYTNKTKGASITYTGKIVEVRSENQSQQIPTSVPNGFYLFKSQNHSLPDRLSITTIRQDISAPISEQIQDLNSTISNFLDSKEIYEKTNSIHKLGILFFGPPGTGKSQFLREFCKSKDAIVIFTREIPSVSFLKRLDSDTKGRLKIFVFDEVIACLEGQHDIKAMLDFLDGESTVSNSIYLLATNYPELIPENVVRIGRIDEFVNMGFPDYESRKNLIKHFLGRDAIEEEIECTKDMPIADIKYICFNHLKLNSKFSDCVKRIKEKNKMITKHFGKTKEISL